MEGAADFIGGGRKVPERPSPSLADLERQVGNAEDIIGTIPKPSELRSEIEKIDKEIERETLQSEQIAKITTEKPSKEKTTFKKKISSIKKI